MSIVTHIRFTDLALAKGIDAFSHLGQPPPRSLNTIVREIYNVGLNNILSHITTSQPATQEAIQHLGRLTTQAKDTQNISLLEAMGKRTDFVSTKPELYPDVDLSSFDAVETVQANNIIAALRNGLVLRSNLENDNETVQRLTAVMFYKVRDNYPEDQTLIEQVYNKFNKKENKS